MSGGGGAPAVQAQYSYSSPFQNPAYNAVAMGTKQSPGPIARSIQIGNQLAQNWQDSYTGAHPGAYYGVTDAQATPQFLANQRVQQGAWSPPNSQTASGVNQFDPNLNRTIAAANPNFPQQTAKQGGIMSLGNFDGGRSSDDEAVNPQGYAKGGPAKPKYNAKSSADDKLSALQTAIAGGYKPKPAETQFMQGMADSAAVRQQLGSSVPYSVDPKTGAIKPAARGANQSTADYKSYLGQLDAAGAALDPKTVKQYGVQTGAATQQQIRTSGVNAPYSMQQAVEQRTAYFDPVTGQSTNPLFNQAVARIQEAQKLPEQFGQATDIYNQVAGKSWAAPGVAQSYMNPYIETALKSQEDLANRQFAQQQNQLRSQAAQRGAFGGSASALAQQAAQQNQNMTLKDLVAQGMNQAYQQGMGQFGTEQQQRLGAAGGLGALGASQAQTNLANIGALGQAAQAQQNLGQQYLNNVQQSAQNYFNWPQQQLSTPINAINQLPSSGGATTQTQRPASALGWKKGGLMNLRKARGA